MELLLGIVCYLIIVVITIVVTIVVVGMEMGWQHSIKWRISITISININISGKLYCIVGLRLRLRLIKLFRLHSPVLQQLICYIFLHFRYTFNIKLILNIGVVMVTLQFLTILKKFNILILPNKTHDHHLVLLLILLDLLVIDLVYFALSFGIVDEMRIKFKELIHFCMYFLYYYVLELGDVGFFDHGDGHID